MKMAKRDIVDEKARDTIPGSGLGKVLNKEAWGAAKATERYGGGLKVHQPPADQSGPQRLGDPNNLQGPKYHNDTPNDWRRGAGAEDKPGYVPGYRPKR
jgi:hypothetical protein